MTDAGGASYEQQLAIAVTNVAENQSRNGTTAADVFTATSDDNWTINAKGGNDTITTLGGNDVVNGGGGNDVLSLGVDKIDLSALDANAGLIGKQAFTFIGDAAFTGLGQLRVGLNGGHVVVEANVTGSLVADFSIVLDSNPALTVGDFVL